LPHSKAGLVVSLLLLTSVLTLLPLGAVHASEGEPTLGTVNAVPTPNSFTAAENNITVLLGSLYTTKVDNAAVSPATHLFAINFSGVLFSGSQFYLILSQSGLSSPVAGDVGYSPIFNVADFANNVGTLMSVIGVNGTFWIGTYANTPIVVGPIPVTVTSAYRYIKVFDGSTGSEAVSTQQLIVSGSVTTTTTATVASESTTTATTTSSTTSVSTTATTTMATTTRSVLQVVTISQTQTVTPTRTVTTATTTTQTQPTTTTSQSTSTSTTTFVTTSTASSPMSADLIYAAVGVVVILVLAILALMLMRRKARPPTV